MNLEKIKLNRRVVLKAAALGAAASVYGCAEEKPSAPLAAQGIIGADGERVLPWRNWSGNQHCQPTRRLAPRNEDQLREIIRESTQTIRFVGSSHSFSPLVPTGDTLLTLAVLRGVESVDPTSGEADIWGGTLLAQIGEPLWEQGRAMLNMPDINTQTLAGAIATSTHGTGATLGSLSSQVTRLRLITAQGEAIDCSEAHNTDLFHAARTHFGALGAVSKVRLQTRGRYYLQESTWMMPLREGLERAETLRDGNRHFELYALPHGDYVLGITLNEVAESTAENQKTDADNSSEQAFRTMAKITDALPFMRSAIINTAARTVEPAQRSGRSFVVFGNLRNIRFNEMEYAVPAEQGPACLQEILATIKREKIDVVFPIEYRYIKADDIWLSPFYRRDSCTISCHNFHDRDYKQYFAAVEPIFWKYGGRPHPGKIHTLEAKHFAELYPRWDDFLKIRQELDPQGKFLNAHLKKVFGSA